MATWKSAISVHSIVPRGKWLVVSVVIALLATAGVGILVTQDFYPSRNQADGEPAQELAQDIRAQAVFSVVRSTFAAISHATDTGNYSVVYDLGSREFQSQNTIEQLRTRLGSLKTNGIQLGGTLVTNPTITEWPDFASSDVLRTAGFFPASGGLFLQFAIAQRYADGKLKLEGFSVNLVGPHTINVPKGEHDKR